MTVLARYLSRMFLVRFVVVLFAVIGFAAVLDLLDVADELVQGPGGGTAAALRYLTLRLPFLLSELMPIAALVTGLLTVGDLLRHRELVVLWGSGVRPVTILLLLLPTGLGLAGVKFLIDDLALPRAAAALRLWGIGDYRHHAADGQAGDYYWLRSGDDILRLSANAATASKIVDLTIFRRDPRGILQERLDAARAEPFPDGWRLYEVTRSAVGGRRTIEQLDQLDWQGAVDLDRVRLMARPPRELPLQALHEIVQAGGYGMRAAEPYRTWLHLRLSGALLPMLLGLLAFALVRRFGRTASIAPLFITAIATGFGLIILGGVASALGEVGLIAPALAAWTPTAALALLVLALVTRPGRLRRRPFGFTGGPG